MCTESRNYLSCLKVNFFFKLHTENLMVADSSSSSNTNHDRETKKTQQNTTQVATCLTFPSFPYNFVPFYWFFFSRIFESSDKAKRELRATACFEIQAFFVLKRFQARMNDASIYHLHSIRAFTVHMCGLDKAQELTVSYKINVVEGQEL